MSNFKSTRFVMALIGIALCILWQIMNWSTDLLWVALGFVGIYTTGNTLSDFAKKE